MTEMPVKISEDRLTATFTWPSGAQALNAAEIDSLLRGLLTVRANMLPQPANANPEPGTPLHPALRWYVAPAPMAPDATQIMVLAAGLGWTGLVLDGTGTRQMIALMESFLQRQNPH